MASRREFLAAKSVVPLAMLLAGCAGLTPADEVNLGAPSDWPTRRWTPMRSRRCGSRSSRAEESLRGAGSCWAGRSSRTIPARPFSRMSWRTISLGTPIRPSGGHHRGELEANAKSVEVMVRAWGVEEGVAFRLVAAHLRALSAQPVATSRPDPCEELADLYRRYPGRTEPREAYALGCTQVRGG